ncbi:MAG: flagellar basal body M-ring protein FliF, partial [Halomonas sp.]|nr:flagellar basal body M-ring protein FliF [Halomonas sp.]
SDLRGDQVEIVNTPFASDEDPRTETVWWQQPDTLAMAANLGRYLLVALVAFLLYWLILRPLIKRYTQPPLVAAATPGGILNTSVGSDDDSDADERDGDVNDGDTYSGKPKRRRKTSLYEHNLNDLREMAQEDPRMVAMIIRSWMNAND